MKLLCTITLMCSAFVTGGWFSDTRTLYLFGSKHTQPMQHQLRLADSARAGILERDVKIVMVENDPRLLLQYKVAADTFMVVLVGKDGGEKYRWANPVHPRQLFAIIDAMPMRRAEMRRQ